MARESTVQLEAATSALATALSAKDVADVLLAYCERELGAAAGVVYFTREDETELYLQGAIGVPERGQLPVLTPNQPLPLATAIQQRKSLWIENYQQLIEQYPAIAQATTPRERMQSVVAMPLVHADRLVGGFALSFAAVRVFDERDRRWLANFAAQCALAAERARLYEAEKQARAEAETLFRIAESLSAAQLDLEVLVQRATDEATAVVGAAFGAFFYNAVNEQGETYVLFALSGAPREAFAKFGPPRNTALFAPTFSGEAVIRLGDVRIDPRYGTMAPHYGMPKGHLPVVSYLAVPVVSPTGGVLGSLFFGHPERDRFTEQHERMVKVLAAGAAAAMDNARLFRATQQAEQDQRRLVAELTATVRLNDLFAGVLAHDLRNPLGAILASAQLVSQLLTGGGQPKLDRLLARIVASGMRMARMIDQLLDFTRIRVGSGMKIEPKALDILELLRRVSEELEGVHEDVRFHFECAGEARGHWDEDRLYQVFSNLLGNAVQHGQHEQGVEVKVDGTDAGSVQVSVHNGGVIPPALVASLFTPFSDSSRAREKSSGLGLGLFISQQIVQAHGGSISLESSEVQGTTFSVVLPRSSEAVQRGVDESPAARVERSKETLERAWESAARLGENSQKFRLLVESVKDYAIFMLDPEGRVATWNAGAERIKGFAARDILGQHFSRFYESGEVQAGVCEYELEVAEREGRFEAEGWRIRKDGSRFWANVVITALLGPNGELLGFAKVTRDLTERRRLEEERLRRAQAEEAVRLRDEFLAMASHELKTPLTVLQLQLDRLSDLTPSLDSAVVNTAARAKRGADRLARLVDSLLEVTRLATDTFTLSLEHFDLAAAVTEAVDSVQSAASSAGSNLSVAIERPLFGVWDRRRIQQLLLNLIWNALTHAAGTPVQISLRRDTDQVLLEVSDQGPGIAAEDLERIFQRFERASSVRDGAGFGLGLYIVREIARAHGGSVTIDSVTVDSVTTDGVTIDSTPSGGAHFVVRLPIAPAGAIQDNVKLT